MDLLWGGDGDGDEEEYVAVLFESSGTHIVLLLYYYCAVSRDACQ